MTTYVVGHDATHAHVSELPPGQAAGYTTGSPDIQWTDEDWFNHPGAVRIDQSPVDTPFDETADALDMENGAATLADIPKWAHNALGNFDTGKRPGQREPLVYASASRCLAVAQTLVVNGLGNGRVGLWVAHWGVGEAQAIADLVSKFDTVPVHALQFANDGNYDADVFNKAWLDTVSVAPEPPEDEPTGPKAVSLSVKYSDGSVKDFTL